MVKPTIFREGNYSHTDLVALNTNANCRIIDIREKQLEELYKIQNPSTLLTPNFIPSLAKFLSQKLEGDRELLGDWVFFPWSEVLLHTVSESENYLLRTNRNRDIITQEEQEKLYDFTISIAGLSVGGNIATAIAYNGFSKNLKLADFDLL